MTIPLEFTVFGKPSSVNGPPAKKIAWKAKVKDAALAALGAQSPPWTGPPHVVDVTIKIFYFPASSIYIDVDNGVKHTIDGFNPPFLKNDRTVTRVITERFMPTVGKPLVVPVGLAPILIQAMQIASGALAPAVPPDHVTVVKVETYMPNAGLW